MVKLFNETSEKLPRSDQLLKLAKTMAKAYHLKGSINLVFSTNQHLRELNFEFRKLNKTTDVLSFPYREPGLMGDIFISLEKAKKQAPIWNNTYYQELRRLVIHGMLHLAGYDHHRPKEKAIMEAEELKFI